MQVMRGKYSDHRTANKEISTSTDGCMTISLAQPIEGVGGSFITHAGTTGLGKLGAWGKWKSKEYSFQQPRHRDVIGVQHEVKLLVFESRWCWC